MKHLKYLVRFYLIPGHLMDVLGLRYYRIVKIQIILHSMNFRNLRNNKKNI